MNNLFPKITAILFGLVFLLGGVSVASAADMYSATATQTSSGSIIPIPAMPLADCTKQRNDMIAMGGYTVTPCAIDATATAQSNANEAITADQITQSERALAAQQAAGLDQGGAFAQANNLLSQISCTGFMDCIAYLPLYLSYVVYILTAGVLILAGYIFDTTLTLGIDKTFILKPFIDSTWTVIRDFSNMAFIFVLIFAGIQTILGIGGWQKTVRNVIIIALLINFSLFFTKVVIDAGNILAVGIYNSMGVVKVDQKHTGTDAGSLPERELSSVLVKAFGPQTFLGAPANTKSATLGTSIFVIGAIVNILVAFAFFRVALIFTGRVIGFWFLMIVSPFAFVSITFPAGNVFNKWLKNLLGLSFVAPVFLFFLYVIMKVLAEGNLFSTLISPSVGDGSSFSFDVLFVPVVMVIFIYLALDKAVSYSKDMASSFGDLGSKIAGTAMGLAAVAPAMTGAAIGGTIRGAGAITSYAANKMGMGGGRLDSIGKGAQSTGKFVGAASAYVDPYKIPKHISKIPGVGGIMSGAAKAAGGALGITDVRSVLKGGDKGKEASKAKKKKEENEATVKKFIEGLHKDAQGNDLADSNGVLLKTTHPIKAGAKFYEDDVKKAIEAKKEALQYIVATTEATLKNTLGTPQGPYVAAVVAKDKAKRDLADFTQASSKAKDISKELKDSD